MKPALLDSIYHKINTGQTFDDLKSLADFYAQKVYTLYLDSLKKSGITNLDETIKVTSKLQDGYILKNTFRAGDHMIEALFHSQDYSRDIKKLDDTFLDNCQCPNKEEVLHKLKFVLIEIGSESIGQDEWLKELGAFSDCNNFPTENDN